MSILLMNNTQQMEDNYHFKVIGNHGWQLSPGKRHCDVSFTCSEFRASSGSPVSGILVPTDVKLIYHTIYFSMFQETGRQQWWDRSQVCEITHWVSDTHRLFECIHTLCTLQIKMLWEQYDITERTYVLIWLKCKG